MDTATYRTTPPPYRPNRPGKIGFIISIICAAVLTFVSIWVNLAPVTSAAMRLCLIVTLVFLALLAILALVLSLSGIKKTPRVLAIIGTAISSMVLLNTLLLILSQFFNFSLYYYN